MTVWVPLVFQYQTNSSPTTSQSSSAPPMSFESRPGSTSQRRMSVSRSRVYRWHFQSTVFLLPQRVVRLLRAAERLVERWQHSPTSRRCHCSHPLSHELRGACDAIQGFPHHIEFRYTPIERLDEVRLCIIRHHRWVRPSKSSMESKACPGDERFGPLQHAMSVAHPMVMDRFHWSW